MWHLASFRGSCVLEKVYLIVYVFEPVVEFLRFGEMENLNNWKILPPRPPAAPPGHGGVVS